MPHDKPPPQKMRGRLCGFLILLPIAIGITPVYEGLAPPGKIHACCFASLKVYLYFSRAYNNH